MYKKKSVSVVVPCHKEESQIGKVISNMPEYVDYIVIVDDASPDRTVEVVNGYKEKNSKVVLICHDVNQGVGGAIATGYKWARDNNIDTAVVMAGDGQMDPEDMPSLLNVLIDGGVDYAKGNRLIWRGAYDLVPRVRFFGNSVLSLLTKIASGYWHVADSQTGYTAVNAAVLNAIDWDKMYKRYGQPNDLLIKLNVLNFRVRDVPVKPVYNVGEVSGIRLRRVVFTISNVLLRGFLWRMWEKYIIRDFHPLVFFYFFGAFLGFVSILFLIRVIILWIKVGAVPELSALAMMFSFSIGMQSIFFAMWFDMEINKHLR